MKAFRWTGLGADGRRRTGRIAAASAAEARRRLAARRLTHVAVRLDPVTTLVQRWRAGRLGPDQLADCFGFLADSTTLALPLADALRMAERSSARPETRAVLARARQGVARGLGLPDALERAGGLPPFAVQLLRTAETSGTADALAETFATLRDHYRLHAEFSRRVRRALVQPAVTGAIVLGVAVFVLLVLIPRLRPLFQLFRDVPALARLLFEAADTLSRHSALTLLALGGLLALGAVRWREVLRRLPALHALTRAIGGFQICTSLALLLRANVPAARALELTADGVGGELARPLAAAGRRVAQGVQLSAALAGVGLRQEVLQTIRRGEQLAQVPQALERAAAHYKRFLEDRFDSLSQSVGLVMTFAAAGLLALVGTAIFLPLYAGLGSLSIGP